MEWLKVTLILLTIGMFGNCKNPDISSFDNNKINELLSNVDENSEGFLQKDVEFDSILTLAGKRTLNSETEPFKIKLFYFGGLVRGYFNLSSTDDKNLQVFGKKIDNMLILKCVTKINMEEAGGYIILNKFNQGIWSNGHVNFNKGDIFLAKQNTDYNSLTDW